MNGEHTVDCPYCWEPVELEADPSAGSAEFVQDCPVCCQPILARLSVAPDGSYRLEAQREND